MRVVFGRLRRERQRRRFRQGLMYLIENHQQLARDGKIEREFTGEELDKFEQAYQREDVLDEMIDQAETRPRFRRLADIASEDQPRDWAGFFEALAAFLVAIMPIIMQLLGAFGLGGISMQEAAPSNAAHESQQELLSSLDYRIRALEHARPRRAPVRRKRASRK